MVCKMCYCLQLVSEHEAKDDEEEKIPDDFYYNFEDHSSRPQITEESGLPNDLLTLQYPFAFMNCVCTRYNLVKPNTSGPENTIRFNRFSVYPIRLIKKI